MSDWNYSDISFWEKEVRPPENRATLPESELKTLPGTININCEYDPGAMGVIQEMLIKENVLRPLADKSGFLKVSYWQPYYLFPKGRQSEIKVDETTVHLDKLFIAVESEVVK